MNQKLYNSIVRHINKALMESLQYQDNISLILNDNTEIHPEELNEDMYPVFLKITTPSLAASNDEILIGIKHAHFISFENLDWQTDNYRIQTTENTNMSVYDKCKNMLRSIKNNRIGRQLPAMSYCNDQIISLVNILYKGYLPSMSQLKVIQENLDYINEIFDFIGIERLRIDNVWSSDEKTAEDSWCLHKGIPEIMRKYTDNPEELKIRALPIFKKI